MKKNKQLNQQIKHHLTLPKPQIDTEQSIYNKRQFKKRALLFKNSVKETWALKLQLIGLVVLMTLSALVMTTLFIANTRIIGGYNTIKRESNIHDFVADLSQANISKKEITSGNTNQTWDKQYYLNRAHQMLGVSNGANNPAQNLLSEIRTASITISGAANPNTSNPNTVYALQQAIKTANPWISTQDVGLLSFSATTLERDSSQNLSVTANINGDTASKTISVTFPNLSADALANDFVYKDIWVPNSTSSDVTKDKPELVASLENANPILKDAGPEAWSQYVTFSGDKPLTTKATDVKATITVKNGSQPSTTVVVNLKVAIAASLTTPAQILKKITNNTKDPVKIAFDTPRSVSNNFAVLQAIRTAIANDPNNLFLTAPDLAAVQFTASEPLRPLQNINVAATASFGSTIVTPIKNLPVRLTAPSGETDILTKQRALALASQNFQQSGSAVATIDRVDTRDNYLDNSAKEIKVIGYSPLQTVDKLIITKGQQLQSYLKTGKNNFGIIFNQQFAADNHIRIGDIVRLQPDIYGNSILVKDNPKIQLPAQFPQGFAAWLKSSAYSNFSWFQVKGFGVSADMISPILNTTATIPNKENQGVAYIDNYSLGFDYSAANNAWVYNGAHDLDVENNSGGEEIYYVGKFNSTFSESQKQFLASVNAKLQSGFRMNQYGQSYNFQFNNSNPNNSNFLFARGDPNYQFNSRTNLIVQVIKAYQYFLGFLIVFVLSIAVVTMLIATKKRIDNSRRQIGILKALGHSKINLMLPFFAYPMMISLIGGTIGFLIGVGLQFFPVQIFNQYFNLSFSGFYFDWFSWFFSIIVSFIVLSAVTMILVWIMLLDKPIHLINAEDTINSSSVGAGGFIKKISNRVPRLSFQNRLKISFFTSSLGKMAAIFTTMLAGSVIVTLALVGPNIIKENEAASYRGNDYKAAIYYSSPVWNVPTSMYRVYNIDAKPWPNDTTPYMPNLVPLVNQFEKGNINEQYYTANPDIVNQDTGAEYLQNLTWRSFNIDSIKLAVKNAVPVTYGNIPISEITMKFAWPDFAQLISNPVMQSIIPTAKWFNSSSQPGRLTWNPSVESNKSTLLQQFKIMRTFYVKYYDTISLSLNPTLYKGSTSTFDTPDKVSFPKDFNHGTTPTVENFASSYYLYGGPNTTSTDLQPMSIIDHHIGGDPQQAILTLVDGKTPFAQWSSSTIAKYLIDMANWFNVTFLWRPTVSVMQAAYSRSPYFVQQAIKTGIKNNVNFNVGFNVEPFSLQNDYLGTYVPVTANNLSFKLLGVQQNSTNDKPFTQTSSVYGRNSQQFLDLNNDQGKNINNRLFADPNNDNNLIPVILNHSAAVKLQASDNSIISLNALVRTLKGYVTDKNNQYAFPSLPDLNSNPNTSELRNDWKWGNIASSSNPIEGYLKASAYMDKAAYNSNSSALPDVKLYEAPTPTGENAQKPSPMAQAIHENTVSVDTDKDNVRFRVVGIQNGYGSPQGFISENNANKIMRFNVTRVSLYKLFSAIWSSGNISPKLNPPARNISTKIGEFPTLQALQTGVQQKNADAIEVMQLFNNCYPIFNYKLSHSSTIQDLVASASVSNLSGDFTPIALNGYQNNATGDFYQRNGISTVNSVLPIKYAREILAQISVIIEIILIFFSVIALVTSIVIITMSSNLIITENRFYICSLKILGYSDKEITNLVTSMYIPIILGAFGAGFPIGWFTIRYIVRLLALNTSWVLPLSLTWWIPVGVAVVVFGIYLITYISSYINLKKIRPLEVLNKK